MKKRYKKISLCFFLIFLLLYQNSCNSDCLKAVGEIDSAEISLSTFEYLEIYDIFDVHIIQDTLHSLKIVTNSTLLKNIEVVQNDSVVVINDLNKCYFARKDGISIKLYVTCSNLKQLIFYNASTFYSIDTLYFNRFLFRAYNKLAFADFVVSSEDHLFVEMWNIFGDVSVAGKSKYLSIINHGSSYIKAHNLSAMYANVTQRSTGDVTVNVSDKLTAIILDIGNVYYAGNPELDTISRNKGRFIKLN